MEIETEINPEVPNEPTTVPFKIKDAAIPSNVDSRSVLKSPVFTYRVPSNDNRKNADATQFYEPEYNFVDIGLAEDTDSIVYQANFKRLALSLKAGWTFVSRNQRNLDYIKRRINEIELAQQSTMFTLIADTIANLLRYHNSFLVKSRDLDTSSGRIQQTPIGDLLPVAGYFVVSQIGRAHV